MKFQDIFKTSDVNGSLGDRFRHRRFKFFQDRIEKLKKPVKILDVGGLESFWVNRGFGGNADYDITVLNLTKTETFSKNIRSMAGDAINLAGIGDKQFDVVFSNSVIEHLYTKDNQILMANEVKRTGLYHFIQTPNKYFPIEPHYVLPFFQYLPPSVKYFILTRTNLSRLHKWDKEYAKQYISEVRLLSYREVKELFPQSDIYLEKIGLLVKSFTAHNFKAD